MLIGVIRKPTLAETASLLKSMDSSLYDLLELRLDACRDVNAAGVAKLPLPLPAIFTLRRREEGGAFAGGEAERLDLLAALMGLRPAYMDLEASLGPERVSLIRSLSPETKIILSRHDFDRTPASLEDMLAPMRKIDRNVIYKIAAKADSTVDALRMLLFCKEQSAGGLELVGISMGENGETSRILAPVVHAGLCYCPVEEPSAPGQLDAATLRDTYNFRRLGRTTDVYGLIGDPVTRSAGHVFHNLRNAATGCDAVYVKWRITREEIDLAMPLLHKIGVRGLSVTMPLKEAVLPFVTTADAAVTAISAANTLKRETSGWSALNTDGAGAAVDLETGRAGEPFPLAGKRVVMLGAGGAARAVLYEAARRGAELIVYNRNADKSLPGAARVLPLSSLEELARTPHDLIINALPFNVSFDFARVPFLAGTRALDLSYGFKSPFLEQAKAAGCGIADGGGMFRTQAELQRRFWGLPS